MSTAADTAARLTSALSDLEKLHALQQQLPARLAAAQETVVGILGELGITAKVARPVAWPVARPRAAAAPSARPARPTAPAAGGRAGAPLSEESLAILRLLRDAGDAGTSAPDLARALGRQTSDVAARLIAWSKASTPRVARDESTTPHTWRLTGPVPELEDEPAAERHPLTTAIAGAAGLEPADL